MNDDKLPNYYNVLIEAQKCIPKRGYTDKHPYTLSEESVEAPDPETAVVQVLRKHWHENADWFPSEECYGWTVFGPDDASEDPWLEIRVEELADCATAVPYERRLRLAGYQPMGFVK